MNNAMSRDFSTGFDDDLLTMISSLLKRILT